MAHDSRPGTGGPSGARPASPAGPEPGRPAELEALRDLAALVEAELRAPAV